MDIHFRIVEFKQLPPEEKNRFFIEMGEEYREKIMGLFFITRIAWRPVKNNVNTSLSCSTFDEAVISIKELKKQLPIYHEIY